MTYKHTRRGNTQINWVGLALPNKTPVKRQRWAFIIGKKPLCQEKPDLHKLPCVPQGFTLIELLVVVLIIGILAAVALPQYQKAVAKTRVTQWLAITDAFKKGAETYILENGWPSGNEVWTFTGDTANKSLSIELPASPSSEFYFSAGGEGNGDDPYYVIGGYADGVDLSYEKKESTGIWQGQCGAHNTTWLAVCQLLKAHNYKCFDYTGDETTSC